MEHPDNATRRWLMCPAFDADPSWRPLPARRAGPAASALRIASVHLLRGAPRPLLRPPLPMAWVQWAMQPRETIAQRLKVLTGVMLQPLVRRRIEAGVRRALVTALGAEGYREAVSHPIDAELAAQLAALGVAEPDWERDGASIAPGLALAQAQLSTLAPYLGWRLRLKFAAVQGAEEPATDEAWRAPTLHPLVERILHGGGA